MWYGKGLGMIMGVFSEALVVKRAQITSARRAGMVELAAQSQRVAPSKLALDTWL